MNNAKRFVILVIVLVFIGNTPLIIFSQDEYEGTGEENTSKTTNLINYYRDQSGVTMTIMLPKVEKEIDVNQLNDKLSIKPVTPPLLDYKDKPVKLRIGEKKFNIIPGLKFKARTGIRENS